MKKLLFISSFMLFISSSIFAQFIVSGEFRTRGEYRDGYKTIPTSSTKPLSMVGQRTRLNVFFQRDKITSYISLQDARIWGEDKWRADNNGLGLFEGWVEYQLNNNLALKVGRQPLIYDDQRLLCSGDWRTFAEAHDIAHLLFTSDDKRFHFHLGYAVNNDGNIEMEAFLSEYSLYSAQYKNMVYGHLNKRWTNGFSASLLGVRDGFQTDPNVTSESDRLKINYRTTFGSYLEYQNNSWFFSTAGYLQRGTAIDNRKINASFYSARTKYMFTPKNSLMLGYDHHSGTDFSTEDALTETRAFSNLYGPGHKFLGYMDYFGMPDKHGAGINDLLLRTNISIGKNGEFEATLHQFNLPKSYLSDGTHVDKNLGQELDFTYSYKLGIDASIKAGFSTFFYTESLEQLKGITQGDGKSAVFGWLMLVVKPTLFTSR